MKRLFDYDPATGIRIDFEGTGDGGFRLHYSQDSEPILDENKAKANAGRDYYARDPDLWRVASIPVVVQYKWLVEKGVDVMNPEHWPAVKRLLNDPEWRYLKTAEVML
jgi:hypothetical protein